MAEKRDYNSKMNSKGLEASVSEEQARGMCQNQGTRYLLLVEVHAGKKTVDEDGSETVNLIPDMVELVPSEHEDAVRTMMKSLYARRPAAQGQAVLEGTTGDGPTADEAAAALPGGEWDGNPDDDSCPSPGCDHQAGHDGEHSAQDKNVVAFSGKGK